MLYLKKSFPQEYEIVLCTITKIQFHSVFATIDEYDLKGMIHISEIAAGRIRNISEYVKEGKVVVCTVLRIDKERGHIDLSLRRVTDMQRKTKVNEMKLEQKAEKIIEAIAHEAKKDVKEIYEKIAAVVFKKYTYIHQFFEEIVAGTADFNEVVLPKEYEKSIIEIVKQRIKLPEVSIRGEIQFKTYDSNGLKVIKDLFKKVENTGKNFLDLKYAGAGIYKVRVIAPDYKKAESVLKEIIDTVQKEIKGTNANFNFVREETK